MPPVDEWETFPFDGDLRARPLLPPVQEEPARAGAGGVDCWRCEAGLDNAIWYDERWLVGSLQKPSGLPVIVILYPRTHHDLGDLPPELAAELGPLIQRVEHAVRSVGEIGRVHVCRWGDGSEHLHWWFMARPARLPQLVGSFAAIWDDILPPTPEDVWRENLRAVARALAAGGGTAPG
jgi:diadenosine tetraphosphate (Ap4A) HIT family hydrolase